MSIAVSGSARAARRPKARSGLVRFATEQPLGAVALFLITLFVVVAVLAPWIAPYDPLAQDRVNLLTPPGVGGHPAGTDELGRDVLSRSLYGARTSLLIAVATLALGGAIGLVIGVVSGYFGGTWVDSVLQRIMDALMAIPSIVLLLFVAALLGPSVRNTVIALSLLVIPSINRVARGEMLRIREEPYVEAARSVAEDFLEGLTLMANMRMCANVPAQHAIQTALGGYQSIEELVVPGGRFYEQSKLASRLLNEIPGVSNVEPRGALYCFPRLDPEVYPIEDDEAFVIELLRAKKILVTHGTGFNWVRPDHFRLVTLPDHDVLEEAIGRIADFLATRR